MGWTSYHADYYKQNGKVDVKAECDAYFEAGLNRGHFKVLKSVLVGKTYYAAIQDLKRYVGKDENRESLYEDLPESERRVWAAILLTETMEDDYSNFAYKEMSESEFPGYCDCPKSILKLLSPTDSKNALAWRAACLERYNRRNSENGLGNLPIGSIIQFTRNNELIQLCKNAPAYQFKTPFWMVEGTSQYMKKKNIPDDYQVVRFGYAQ